MSETLSYRRRQVKDSSIWKFKHLKILPSLWIPATTKITAFSSSRFLNGTKFPSYCHSTAEYPADGWNTSDRLVPGQSNSPLQIYCHANSFRSVFHLQEWKCMCISALSCAQLINHLLHLWVLTLQLLVIYLFFRTNIMQIFSPLICGETNTT